MGVPRERRLLFIVMAASSVMGGHLAAQGIRVSDTVHNLSVTGPGQIRAAQETEVCKFCHVPHNAVVPSPLWGHTLSDVEVYETPIVRSGSPLERSTLQPDGSSKLCLSCHDGTVALGDLATERTPIRMVGAQRLTAGRPGFIGTDLSGDHPISFVVPDGNSADLPAEVDMGIKPLKAITADPDVKLDRQGKMQCTSCHDPHSDVNHQPGLVPRFWVKPTVEEVCLACHALR